VGASLCDRDHLFTAVGSPTIPAIVLLGSSSRRVDSRGRSSVYRRDRMVHRLRGTIIDLADTNRGQE
jgi:hypothetical protein